MEASTPLLTKWLCKTFQTLLDQKWNREWEGKPFLKPYGMMVKSVLQEAPKSLIFWMNLVRD